MGNDLASAAKHSGCFSDEDDRKSRSHMAEVHAAHYVCNPNCLVNSEAEGGMMQKRTRNRYSAKGSPAVMSPSHALDEADRVVESRWMHSPVLKCTDSSPCELRHTPMSQKACDAPSSQAMGPKLTEDALMSLEAHGDHTGASKGMGKGKGKQPNRCDSMASNFATAGSFAKGAGRMSFQADMMKGSRGSFAQPRSDASFAAGLPPSAANAGRSRQSFTTQPSEGINTRIGSMSAGGTSTQPPPKGSSTSQHNSRMGMIHE
jgi:hypothetical protein